MTQFAFPVTGLDSGWPDGSDGWGNSFRSNMAIMQAFARRYVIDQTTTAPPGSPVAGDCYIVGTGATGAWAGRDGQVAIYGELWYYITPEEGFRDFYDGSIGRWYQYTGSAWADQQNNDILSTLRNVNVIVLPVSGSVSLTEQETPCGFNVLLGTLCAADVEVQYDTVNDRLVPVEVYFVNLFNNYNVNIKSETTTETVICRPNQLVELITGISLSFWEDYMPIFHAEMQKRGFQLDYHSPGDVFTADNSDLGLCFYTDGDPGIEVTIPSNATVPNQLSNARFALYGYVENISKIVADTGVTIVGPTEVTYGELLIVTKVFGTDEWLSHKCSPFPSQHGGISTETGTAYSLTLADRGKVKNFTDAALVTVTIPKIATADMGFRAIVEVMASGAAGVAFSPEDGSVTLLGLSTIALNDKAKLMKDEDTDTWYITKG